MTRKLTILCLLLLVASSALAITIRIANGTANNVIITPAAAQEPEPGDGNVFAGGVQVFANGTAVFVQ